MDVRALSLAERLGLDETAIRRPKRAEARERIGWWKEDAFGGDGRLMGKWLRAAGVPGMRAFERLVELTGEVEHPDDPPPSARGATFPQQTFRPEQLANGWALTGALTAPCIQWGGERIGKALQDAAEAGLEMQDAAHLRQQLTANLGDRLHTIAVATLALAMNIARLRGRLSGETPTERALSFAQHLATEEGRAEIFDAYPVLERRLWSATRTSVSGFEEMLTHAAQDRPALQSGLGVKGKLRAITPGRGDPHRGGKTVSFLDFESGRVVYKPKSLRLDRAFHDLLRWINAGVEPQAPTLTVLDHGDRGWVEFIEIAEARNEAEVAQAYVRMGMLLAAMLACRSSDMHLENVLFSGGRPYVVDLETVLTPQPLFPRKEKRMRDATHETDWAILSIGYLPNNSSNELDLSAAAAVSDQETSYTIPVLGGFESDSPSAEHKKGMRRPGDNAPRLGGALQPAADYVAELEEGFRLAYRRILEGRAEFFAEGGPFAGFENAPVRWVPRATMDYGRAIANANHPSAMRDGIDQEFGMARIMAHRYAPARYLRILRSEVEDLWTNDVPYFFADSSSRDLVDSRDRVFSDFFSAPAAERMREAVEEMSEGDLERNVEALRAAFAVARTADASLAPPAPIEPARAPADADDLTAEAMQIGDRLLAGAAVHGREVSWISFRAKAESVYAIAPTGPDLYGGTAGIGLFLAQLGAATGEARFTEMAKRCRTATRNTEVMGVGAFSGTAGALYFELRAADLMGGLNERKARRWLEQISRDVAYDHAFDLIAGAAGALIVSLRAMRRPELADPAAAAARACARRLHEAAERDGGVARWHSQTFGLAMGGLSHGAAGVALALTELAATIGGEEDLQLAKEALAFEDTLFDPKSGTWRDARGEGETGDHFPVSWCHGAPGILLALQRIQALLGDDAPETVARDIERAMRIVVMSGGGGSHCLCHGALGNLEPLLLEGGERSRKMAQGLAAVSIDAKRNEGDWRGGVPGYYPLPGLMGGVAGVGYGLLRVADPTIPSVLILET